MSGTQVPMPSPSSSKARRTVCSDSARPRMRRCSSCVPVSELFRAGVVQNSLHRHQGTRRRTLSTLLSSRGPPDHGPMGDEFIHQRMVELDVESILETRIDVVILWVYTGCRVNLP